NFYAAGINYRAHIVWANSRGGNHQVPAQADIGYRSPNALLPTDADIVLPPDAGRVEYEGELVAVIGRRAKNSDTFKPMGPYMVYGIDPTSQTIEVRINGRTVSRYSTSGMIYGVAHYLSRMARRTPPSGRRC